MSKNEFSFPSSHDALFFFRCLRQASEALGQWGARESRGERYKEGAAIDRVPG